MSLTKKPRLKTNQTVTKTVSSLKEMVIEINRIDNDVKHNIIENVPNKRSYSEKYPPKYKPGIVYTLTINPNDQHQYMTCPKKSLGDYDRLEQFRTFAQNLITSISINGIICNMNIDVSSPFQKSEKKSCARLHLHGCIYFSDVTAIQWFHLYGATYIFDIGTMEMDTIDDFDTWIDYCTKTEWMGLPQIGHFMGYSLFRDHWSKPETGQSTPTCKKVTKKRKRYY